jgi:hypothetical protein
MRIGGLKISPGANQGLPFAKAPIGRRRWTSTDAQRTKPEWLYRQLRPPSRSACLAATPRHGNQRFQPEAIVCKRPALAGEVSPDVAPAFSECDNRGPELPFGNGSVIVNILLSPYRVDSVTSNAQPCRLESKIRDVATRVSNLETEPSNFESQISTSETQIRNCFEVASSSCSGVQDCYRW